MRTKGPVFRVAGNSTVRGRSSSGRRRNKRRRGIHPEFRKGVTFAASVADDYNGSTTHPYRLGDCIMAKLNLRRQRPRKNERALPRRTNLENRLDSIKFTVHGGICEVRAPGETSRQDLIRAAEFALSIAKKWRRPREAAKKKRKVRDRS